MKDTLFSRHTAIILQYIGIGLISGAISHGFFSGFRSLATAFIGIVIFIIGLAYERRLSGSKIDIGRMLLIGVIFSISTAMVAGGIQHFLDSPWRSAWIIPLGYLISVIVFREKEGIKNSFSNSVGRAIFVAGILLLICYPLARIVPAQFNNNHHTNEGDNMMQQKYDGESALRLHCQEMPNMKACEKLKNILGSSDITHHKMSMNHSSMITSEEAFVVNMIPHHQEAVDTAQLVIQNGQSPELRKLAEAIIVNQEKEISMMKGWLRDWKYSKIPSTYQNMMGDGSQLKGLELDRWFLQGMIMHHMGAVEMAEKVLTLQARPETYNFAKEIITLQAQEIRQMKLLLGENVNDMRDDMRHGH